jgi:delta14-sterol reductase
MGLQLNPRWLGVDLKMFAYQPSLILLALLVAAFGFAQHERYGALTPQMWLYQAMWWVYLVTHYLREKFLLQIWDIIAEKFGLALLWGDLVLVPFFYCIAGWALLEQREPMPTWALIGIALLYLAGLVVFRGANAQKDRFKADPEARIWGRPARAIGGRLLVSGFWGCGRHLNYSGEIIVYCCFGLVAGFESWTPYLVPLWLTGLLSHRALRDERRCRAKYGDLWERYCEKARYRMVPFLF